MNEEKHHLYELILQQLVKDGYTRAAEHLSDTALIPLPKSSVVVRGDEPDLEAIVHHHMLTHIPMTQQQRFKDSSNLVELGESTLDYSSSDR